MVLKRALVVAFLLFLHAYATIENLPALIKQTKPAIVSIYVYNKGDELIEGGSGFFISDDVIVSSRHVFWKQKKLPEAFSARVRTNDRDNPAVYTIKSIIHDDVDTDLILLKIDTEGHTQPYLTLADEVPDEGEEVFVISSPEGLEGVVSTGIISAHHNEIDMQISCPISSGSSGAPVMNKRGEVVGIVNGYFTVGQLINFAINVRRLEMLVLDVDHTKRDNWPSLPEWTATHSTMIPANNFSTTTLPSSLWSPLRWWAGVANFTKAIFGTSKTVTPMPEAQSTTASTSKTTATPSTTTPATSPIDDPLVRSRRETCAK